MVKKRGNKAKWIILGIFVIALILFALNFNKIIPSKQNMPSVDAQIYERFNNNATDNLRLIIKVKDSTKINQTASSLIKKGLQFVGMSDTNDEFIARVNRTMLAELEKDSRIALIYYSGGRYHTL